MIGQTISSLDKAIFVASLGKRRGEGEERKGREITMQALTPREVTGRDLDPARCAGDGRGPGLCG